MRAFTIPTIYTAVDKMSAVFAGMERRATSFNSRLETMNARSERLFRRLTPHISEASKQFLAFAGTAAAAGAAVSGVVFSARSIMEYETELASLKAITGLSGKEFDAFKSKIEEVAKATGKNTIEVTKAFTAIANNQPELLKSADALSAVTQSTITLAQASQMELQPAGEAITQILNQFGKGAKDAAKLIDILAAGSVAGSSEIRDTAAAIQAFGTVASNLGIKIDESVALIELGSKFEKGAEAGNKFRNILLEIAKGSAQDKQALKDWHRLGVNMKTVTDTSLPLAVRLKEISKIAKDNTAIMHTFGKENAAMATGILNNVDKLDGMIQAVNTQGMAAEMAQKNNDTLAKSIERLKNKWVNFITTSDKASQGINMARKAIGFLADHMETIIDVGVKVLAFFALWKASIIAIRVATTAYNIALGVTGALTGVANIAIGKSAIALQAYNVATRVAAAAQWLWNAALSASPLTIAVGATIALTAAAYGLHKAIKAANTAESIKFDLQKRVLENTIEERATVIELFAALRNLKVGTDAYNSTLQKINEIQPGIINKYHLQKGAIKDMAAAERELTTSIMARAEAEARAELLRESIRNRLQLQAEGPSMFQKITALGGPNADLMNKLEIAAEDKRINMLAEMSAKEQINPKAAQQNALAERLETTNNAKVQLEINANGAEVTARSDSKNVSVVPKVGSTMINK